MAFPHGPIGSPDQPRSGPGLTSNALFECQFCGHNGWYNSSEPDSVICPRCGRKMERI